MKRAHTLLLCIAAILACLFALIPILWGVTTALKPPTDVLAMPPKWLPIPPTLENFKQVITGSNLLTYFKNSIFVGGSSVLLTMFLSIHAAYAAARFSFPGKNIILFTMLSIGMIPLISVVSPLYLVAAEIGLHDTFLGVIIVYTAWRLAPVVLLLKGFIESIPSELEEAAMIDGCSRLTAFYRATLPLMHGGLASAALLSFIFVWNDFLIAYTLTISDSKRLIQSGLYLYITAFGVEWGQLMAAVVVALAPVLILFLLLQTRFIEGLTAGATKG
jgi:multiple sugar transport system permease protein